MPDKISECDALSIVLALCVFALPLTILIPDFSVWDFVPKVQIMRWHLFSQSITWSELNGGLIVILSLFFCFYLEIRKRKLNDLVDTVLLVTKATEVTMEEERERQAAAVGICVELLDASTEHYENLILLRNEFHRSDKNNLNLQHPPVIELSLSEM